MTTRPSMQQLRSIQRAFADTYLDHQGVIGVRVRRLDAQDELVVTVDSDRLHEDLPQAFQGLPVNVVEGRPAVLAYAVGR